MKLHHVTLTTGDARWSSREEVDPRFLAQLRSLVGECERAGQCDLPTPDGIMVLRRIAPSSPSRHVAIWALSEPQGPALVTIALAMRDRAGAGVWRMLHEFLGTGAQPPLATNANRLPPAPWLAAGLHLPALLPPHPALRWLGDAERCIAWAWIDEIWTPGQPAT